MKYLKDNNDKKNFSKFNIDYISNFFCELITYLYVLYNASKQLNCSACSTKHPFYICNKHKKLYKYKKLKYNDFNEAYEKYYKNQFKKYIVENTKKKPIVIFGCSFAQGWNIDDNYSLGNLLSKQTNRSVYNRAYADYFSSAQMLYQTKKNDFYNEVEEPQYVIYVYIKDHLRRIYLSHPDMIFPLPYLHYKSYENDILEEKNYFKYNFFLFREYSILKEKYTNEIRKKQLQNKILLQTKIELDKHWKNYEFIILVYQNYEINNPEWKQLERMGFKVIFAESLLNNNLQAPEYTLEDRWHPNEKAWRLIVPKLVETLKL